MCRYKEWINKEMGVGGVREGITQKSQVAELDSEGKGEPREGKGKRGRKRKGRRERE